MASGPIIAGIHKNKIFDIGLGLGADNANVAKLAKARDITIIKKAASKFREAIDSATPAVYIIREEIDVILPIAKALGISDTYLSNLRQDLKEVLDSIGIEKPITHILSSLDDSFDRAMYQFSDLSSGEYSQLAYRTVAIELGREIKALFSTGSNKVILCKGNLTSIFNDPNITHVYFSTSFNTVQSAINKKINDFLKANQFNILFGDIQDAGHTAVKFSDSTYRTNTPATQESLFLLEAESRRLKIASPNTAEFQDSFVKNVPLFIDTAITFNHNFELSAKNLLEMNFSFVIPMPKILNSSSGAVELKAVKAALNGRVLPALAKTVKERLNFLKGIAIDIYGSPSIRDYIKTITLDSLNGTTTKGTKYSQVSKKSSPFSIAIPTIKPKGTTKFISIPIKKSRTQVRTPQGQFISPVSIKNLLNKGLAQQIQKNMGKGNAKAVLNYRTGRFANSAEVTNVTNRGGAITAFYSYMKNPYETFAPGGAQGSPASRDPNKLIATSIRQLATTIMQNRLKVVPV